MDADLLKTLVQDFNCGANPEQGQCTSPDQPLDPVLPPPIRLDRGHSESGPSEPQLIIDHFPQGSPGTPIPGVDQGPHAYKSSQDMFGPSIWAPFRSQRD
jgi:hypothetical protein